MGGHAFKNVELQRIKREDIDMTLHHIADVLYFEDMDLAYMKQHLLGSVGKQADSGDIDIILDSVRYDSEALKRLNIRCRDVLDDDMVRSQGLKAGQLNTVFPIAGDPEKGFVQVDFIYGPAEWLKFSHWSPGKDRSPWKGVFISQTLGVLAKMQVLYQYPENAVVDKENKVDERLAQVAYAYNLEQGLRVRCKLWDDRSKSFGEVDADTFETKCPVVPKRVPRQGYITDPETVLRMIFKADVKPSEVETFEDLLYTVHKHFTDEKWDAFKKRVVTSIMRSSAKREVNVEELEKLLEESENEINKR